MSDQETYERFIDWLKGVGDDLPEVDELRPLIKATYTPEEASLLTGVTFSGRDLQELADMKHMNPAELRQQFDTLAKKGLLFRTIKGDTVRYRLNNASLVTLGSVFWPGLTDERSKAIAPLANRYYYHGFWEHYRHTHMKILRALPSEGTIEHTHQILPYEDVVKILDSLDYFSVSTCPCRHRKNIDPESPNCKYPTENCLHFGELGRYIVENDLGREITRQEAHDILQQCAELGLVHGVANYQEEVAILCNCCKCCCALFEAFHKLKHPEGMSASNYWADNNSDTCIGCGLCVRRCPMEAIHLEEFPAAKDRVTVVVDKKTSGLKELKNKNGKVSAVNRDLCIGCGVCAYKCPTNSLALVTRDHTHQPPKDAREYTKLLMADFAAARARSGEKRDKNSEQ